MTSVRMKLVEEAFLAAASAPIEEREGIIAQRCAGDAQAAEEVRSLLAHNDTAGDQFLDTNEVRRMSAAEPESALPPGTRVAGYSVVGLLGRGGMGMVYLATQERPRRTVALKLVRPSLSTPSVWRRFEMEAEMLGMLQHPGIAQVFEAGTADAGRGVQPFMAMEYVSGPPLTTYAKQTRLTVPQRIELMARVCDALHHAHQRGIIHRDIKPGNILVDPSGQPKILDFGVSRAVDPDLRVTTFQTSAGQLIGTLAYMSPEQAIGDPTQIDTRSDVYALGVVMYELLTGSLPFDLTGRSIPEAARVIHEGEPKRLTTFGRVFRGDIETIVSKAIEKDKTRRYQSAAALGDDLRRHLSGLPIAAKQDSAFYVIRKQVRRHKAAAAAIAAFVITGSTLGIHAAIQARQNERLAAGESKEKTKAQEALIVAERERVRADNAATELARQLRAANIERGRLTSLTGSVNLAEDAIWPELFRDPRSPHAFWALWELYSNWPCRATIASHQGTVSAIGFSPTGDRILTGGQDGTVRIWDGRRLRPLRELHLSSAPVILTRFCRNGERIVACDSGGRVMVLDPVGGCELDFRAEVGRVLSAALSPDGTRIAIGCVDGLIDCRDLSDGSRVWTALRHVDDVNAVDFSPDGQRLVSGSYDTTVRVWDAATGDQLDVLLGHRQPVGSVAWSPDGRLIVSGSSDRTARLWDVATGVCIQSLSPINGTISRLAFSPDSSMLAVGGWWRTDVYDTKSGSAVWSFSGHRRGPTALSFWPDGNSISTGSVDADLRIWDLPATMRPKKFPAHEMRINALTFNPDGSRLLSGGFEREVVLWDPRLGNLRPIARFKGGGAYGTSVCFLGDSGLWAHVTEKGYVQVRRSEDGSPVCALSGLPRTVLSLASTSDGSTLYVADGRQILTRWDVATGQCTGYFGLAGRDPLVFRISPDGTRLDSTQRDYILQSWRLPGMEELPTIITTPPIWSLGESPDSRRLAVGNWQSEIDIFDADTRSRIALLEGHRQLVVSTQFLRGGRLLLSASNDGTIKLWDTRDPRCLATLTAPCPEGLSSGLLSPDGHTVVGGGGDGALYVWDLHTFDRHIAGNLEAQLRKRQEREPSAVDEEHAAALREWATRVMTCDDVSGNEVPIGGLSGTGAER